MSPDKMTVGSKYSQISLGPIRKLLYLPYGTIHILRNQSGWVGGVGKMIMFYAKMGCLLVKFDYRLGGWVPKRSKY